MKGMICLHGNKITLHSTRHTFKRKKAGCARGCFTALNTEQNLYKKIKGFENYYFLREREIK